MSGAHRFDATVEAGGWGSILKLDGVELSPIKSFAIRVDCERAALEVEVAPNAEGNLVSGFVDAITWLGTLYVATDGSRQPLAIFGTETAASEFLSTRGYASGFVYPVEARVTR